MITCKLHEVGFNLSGHAGYAEKGSDIVCAAVSCLVDTFRASAAGNYEEFEDDGLYICRWETLPAASIAKVEMLYTGLRLIAESYPDNVRVETCTMPTIYQTGPGSR